MFLRSLFSSKVFSTGIAKRSGLGASRSFCSGNRGTGEKEGTSAASAPSSSFSRYLALSVPVAISAFLAYHFYQARGNPHIAEIRITEALKKLPLYPPHACVHDCKECRATTTAATPKAPSCPEKISSAFFEWFLREDARQSKGIERAAVIGWLADHGLALNESQESEFVNRGRGRVPEERRLSSVGLVGATAALENGCQGKSGFEVFEQMSTRTDLATVVHQGTLPEVTEITEAESMAIEVESLKRRIDELDCGNPTDAERERLKDLQKQLKDLGS